LGSNAETGTPGRAGTATGTCAVGWRCRSPGRDSDPAVTGSVSFRRVTGSRLVSRPRRDPIRVQAIPRRNPRRWEFDDPGPRRPTRIGIHGPRADPRPAGHCYSGRLTVARTDFPPARARKRPGHPLAYRQGIFTVQEIDAGHTPRHPTTTAAETGPCGIRSPGDSGPNSACSHGGPHRSPRGCQPHCQDSERDHSNDRKASEALARSQHLLCSTSSSSQKVEIISWLGVLGSQWVLLSRLIAQNCWLIISNRTLDW
jgi:hypothetical protein